MTVDTIKNHMEIYAVEDRIGGVSSFIEQDGRLLEFSATVGPKNLLESQARRFGGLTGPVVLNGLVKETGEVRVELSGRGLWLKVPEFSAAFMRENAVKEYRKVVVVGGAK